MEQSFNSLDAQREACEAYVASQKSEGWIILAQMYDDGGISGGTMDRPALQRLLADIEAGLIDTVVVYKVDRLTRSLGDFTKIVEVFDAASVSFVSVTQSFNTTTSMGRLTLNMLLSFAQFEREVTGERIRDKIAASKAKGMWMGGRPPLGYEVRDRKLEIVEAEAETVRHIFTRYTELGSVLDLRDELAAAGITAKRHVSVAGNVTGGGTLGRGALYHLLQNRLYHGEIDHKGTIHPGEHEAIVDEAIWDRVQAVLTENRGERAVRSDAASPSLLAGLVRDDDGMPLTPTHANKKGRRYRYYVSHDLIAGRKAPTTADVAEQPRRLNSARRIPATDLEAIVEGRLVEFLGDASAIDTIVAPRARDIEERQRLVARAGEIAVTWAALAPTEKVSVVHRLVKTIVVTRDRVDITIGADAVLALTRCRIDRIAMPDRRAGDCGADATEADTLTLTVPAVLKRDGMEMRHLVEAPQSRHAASPIAVWCCSSLGRIASATRSYAATADRSPSSPRRTGSRDPTSPASSGSASSPPTSPRRFSKGTSRSTSRPSGCRSPPTWRRTGRSSDANSGSGDPHTDATRLSKHEPRRLGRGFSFRWPTPKGGSIRIRCAQRKPR